MSTQKMRALSYIGAEKITFPPKPDIRSDIRNYRVASLLKKSVNRKKLPLNIIKERIQKEKDALKKEEEDELENKKEADIVFQGKRMIIDKDRKMNINYSPLPIIL